MNIHPLILFMLLVVLSLGEARVYAQEEHSSVAVQGQRYVELKVEGLNKYNDRLAGQQKHLLNRLKRKEKRFAHKLEKTDSATYARYKEQNLSYDSISKLSQSDTGAGYAAAAQKRNASIDSLRKIEGFVQSKTGAAGGNEQNAELNKLQGQLNYKAYVNELIAKRTTFLKNLAGKEGTLPGLTGIQKDVFYGKARMKVFKEMNDDPTAAEDKAMEYLQGSEGFDKTMHGSESTLMGGNATDASQLEKMGYQTKDQMQKNLQAKFGNNLGGVAKQMNAGIKDWQDKTKDMTGNAKETKTSLKKLGHTEKPAFKVNPMRGLPFMKRIEKQYNWQTTRATSDGAKPALLDLSAMAGFKHTPKLTYGIGLASSFGLGQSWQSIHFSFQGIGYRTFAKWEWQYGIGAYAGYERMYKQAAFIKQPAAQASDAPTTHNTGNYMESVLVGLTKSYNINTKYKGAIQLLYDIWWQQKGLTSPLVLRFVTIKK